MIKSGDSTLLDVLREAEKENIPEGWLTCKQWAEKWGLSLQRARALLARGIQKGIVESKKFKIDTANGYFPIVHYKKK